MSVTLTAPSIPTTSRDGLPLAAPSRSLEQRMNALDLANEVRSARAGLKRDLHAGRVSFLDLLADPPAFLETAKVWDFLIHVPKVGRVKVQKTFKHHKISASKTFDGLSTRQRTELLADREIQRWTRS